MLDGFIIDELKKREQERIEDDKRPVLEVPLPEEMEMPEESQHTEEECERGVAIIDFTI